MTRNENEHSDVERRFTYHPPKGTQADRYEHIRNSAKYLAHLIVDDCPSSRERALSLTHLQNAVMWANSAIAVNEA